MNTTQIQEYKFQYFVYRDGNNFTLSVTSEKDGEIKGYATLDTKGNQSEFTFYELHTNDVKDNVYLYRFCIEKVRAIILRIAKETDTICPLAIIRFGINGINRVNVFDYLFDVWDFEKTK